MDERDTAILRALLKNHKMTFQQIVDNAVPNRNSARKTLNKLIGLKLMAESPKVSSRGYKHWFTLTKKGRVECIRCAVNDLNERLEVVQVIGDAILSEPSLIDEFREKSRQALLETKIMNAMPLDERIRVVSREMKRVYGPVMEAYKAMHKLMIQLEAPEVVRDSEFFIGFTKEGAIHMIPRVILERLGLEIL